MSSSKDEDDENDNHDQSNRAAADPDVVGEYWRKKLGHKKLLKKLLFSSIHLCVF